MQNFVIISPAVIQRITVTAPTKIASRLAWGVLALCLCTATATQASSSKKSQAQGAAATTPKRSKAVRVRHQQNNSGESTAERDRRLYRECKGRPNAGACLGYTER